MAPAEAATKPGCPVHKRDGPSHGLVLLGDRDSNRADDKITVGADGNELPLWGLTPEGTVQGGPVAARAPRSRSPHWRSAPSFRRRYYLAASTGGIETMLALDEQGQQITHFPWFPDPQPQSSTGPSAARGAAAPHGAFARLIHFVTP